MPFKDFLTQFEKGLHPRFRQLYYLMREDNMNRGILKNIVQKLHRSQESLVENSYPSASASNYHPQANGQYNADSRYRNNFRNNRPTREQQNRVPNTRTRDGRPQCKDCRRYGHYSCRNRNNAYSNGGQGNPNGIGRLR
ncbi:hypothetical protein ABEB36_010674 [Hypothenemus hampei]|uniref:Uncharacterized protein n=1 Tax=Hypothenemus hampei TaxID=57062 RepID=A0ABD1EES9_HYPHA